MSAPYPATATQQRILRFVHGYQLAHGGSTPTIRAILRGIGGVGLSGIVRALEGLEERGYLTRGDAMRGQVRPIAIHHPPAIPTAPDGAPLFAVPLAREGASDG